MEFNEILNEKVGEINSIIGRYLFLEDGYQKTVFEAMNYSILAGGKRIRPILLLETYRMMDGDRQLEEAIVWPFLTALEFIHTYSLVHDDLPAMDNDRYRRGKLTTHAQYGHAMGILAGDALLNYSFELCSKAFASIDNLPAEKQMALYSNVAKALKYLSEYSGVYGMLGGQVVDVEQSGKSMDLSMLNFVYNLKTGALLKAAMTIGGALAGAKEKELDCLMQTATDVGMAFQIQDDILDVTSTDEVLGKPVHSDEKNQKSTYVTLLGIDACKTEVERLSERAVKNLKSLKREDSFIEQLIRFLITRNK